MTNVQVILRAKYGDSHPGLKLVRVVPFAIPLWPFKVTMTIYEAREYPLLNEHVLRCVNLGLRTIDSIADVLGLETGLVAEALADEQVTNGTVYADGKGSYYLTSFGVERIRDFVLHESKIIVREVFVDRLTGKIEYFDDTHPSLESARKEMSNYYLGENELILPEAEFKDKVNAEFFTPESLNVLFGDGGETDVQASVLDVISAKRKGTRPNYKIALLMIFADAAAQIVEFDLAIDGVRSDSHNKVLARPEVTDKLGISVEPEVVADAPTIPRFGNHTQAGTRAKEILETVHSLTILEETDAEIDAPNLVEESGEEAFRVPSPRDIPARAIPTIFRDAGRNVRVRVEDHPGLLSEALQYSQKRLLIVSPWARSAVVNSNFIMKIKQAARRGVVIDIAFGFGDGFADSHEYSVNALVKAAAEQPGINLHKINSHEKILIADSAFINTSFNWLSFSGVNEHHYRRENGTRFVNEEQVKEIYDEFLAEIHAERDSNWP